MVVRGFGPHMTHTHSVIMWYNQDGTMTLSQRYTSEYREPKLEGAPPRVATIAKPGKLIVSTAVIHMVQAKPTQSLYRIAQPTLLHMPSRSPPTSPFYIATTLANHWYSPIPSSSQTSHQMLPSPSITKLATSRLI